MSTSTSLTQIWLPGCWGTGYVRCPLNDAQGPVEEIKKHAKEEHHIDGDLSVPDFDLEAAMVLLADRFGQYLYRTKVDDLGHRGWIINSEYGSSRTGSPSSSVCYPTLRAAAYSALAGIRQAAKTERENLNKNRTDLDQRIELLDTALAPV